MPNSKISALNPATTPLAGAEILPIIQGGVTVKATVANLTGAGNYAGSFTSLAYTTTLTGGTGIVALGTNQFYKDASGNIGIGTAAPGSKLEINESTNVSLQSNLVARGGNSLTAQHRYLTKTSGGVNTGGAVGFNATYGLVLTASSTSIDGARDLIVDSAGSALVIGGGGLGYGTGSGGTVTQVTSRTTGVTLNKTNGAITLVSAAGMAVFQSFTVTNSKVAATDVVQVSQKSGTDLYQIFVTAVAAGSFRITFATTGGVTVEQPVFNFAIIKAVTA
jgi:hypothetical protein